MRAAPRSGLRLVGAVAVAALAAGAILLLGPAASRAETFPVEGTFVLWDDFPIAGTGELCDAKRSFYHDINRDTAVSAETVHGTELAMTTLGDGRIASAEDFLELVRAGGADATLADVDELFAEVELKPCVFRFRLDLVSGSDGGAGYVILLGRRGRWEMSEERLRQAAALQLSVGLR